LCEGVSSLGLHVQSEAVETVDELRIIVLSPTTMIQLWRYNCNFHAIWKQAGIMLFPVPADRNKLMLVVPCIWQLQLPRYISTALLYI
jgi:hypothetical protein